MSFDCKHLSMQLNPFFRELSRDLWVCIVGQLCHRSVFETKIAIRALRIYPEDRRCQMRKKDRYQFGQVPFRRYCTVGDTVQSQTSNHQIKHS